MSWSPASCLLPHQCPLRCRILQSVAAPWLSGLRCSRPTATSSDLMVVQWFQLSLRGTLRVSCLDPTPSRYVLSTLPVSVLGVASLLTSFLRQLLYLSLIHISEPTRLGMISYA